jgi:hypothetical protein
MSSAFTPCHKNQLLYYPCALLDMQVSRQKDHITMIWYTIDGITTNLWKSSTAWLLFLGSFTKLHITSIWSHPYHHLASSFTIQSLYIISSILSSQLPTPARLLFLSISSLHIQNSNLAIPCRNRVLFFYVEIRHTTGFFSHFFTPLLSLPTFLLPKRVWNEGPLCNQC